MVRIEQTNKWTDPIVVVGVIVGVIYFGILIAYLVQLKEMRKATEAATNAAKAASRNAAATLRNTDVLVSLESPKVFVREIRLFKGGIQYGDLLAGASVRLDITNYGRTPAILISHCVESAIVDDLPIEPEYRHQVWLHPEPAIDRLGRHPIEAPLVALLIEDQVQIITTGSNTLWLYGCVNFGDILQDTWQLGFCYRWVERDAQGRRGFRPVNKPGYTYYRKE